MTDIVESLKEMASDTRRVPCDFRDTLNVAIAEIERLRAGGCARNQRLTQYCAEVPTAVLAEREACAKVADHYATMERLGLYGSVAVSEGASKIAAAIRARTEDR